jgi:hypothetical protein
MTRRRPPAEPTADLLRPCDLALAPQLASLAQIQEALRIALLALVAEHPGLDDFPAADEPPTLRLARRFVVSADALQRALRRYRCAVFDAFMPPVAVEPDSDIPF